MQVHGLVGQTEEGIWPEAQLQQKSSIFSKCLVIVFYFNFITVL